MSQDLGQPNGGTGTPPLISGQVPVASLATSKTPSIRALIAFLLTLCLIFFFVDGLVSFLDDSLALFARIHFISGIRGIVVGFSALVGFLTYLVTGLTPAVPKRWFVPLALFDPLVFIGVLPVWIYWYDRGQAASWLVSLLQLLFGLIVLWRMQGGLKLHWPLVPEEVIQGPLFSWANLVSFCVMNLVLVLPGVVLYLVLCGGLAINHFSEGFITLRRAGITVQVRNYVRDDGKSILLVPMSHIGEAEFYRSLSASFSTNSTILMEGVTDENNLLTNGISYHRIASSLGLSQQQKEFKPSPIQVVRADIDVDEFSPGTISFLNLVMLIHSKGLTPQNLFLVMQSSNSPEFETQIFEDLLKKRNRHLIGEIETNLKRSDALVVPWGAAHIPEIAHAVEKLGFRLDSSRECVAVSFHHQHNRVSLPAPVSAQ